MRPWFRQRSLFTLVLLLAMLAFAQPSIVQGLQPDLQLKQDDRDALERLKRNARGSVSVSTKKSTTLAGFVRAGRNGDLLPGNSSRTPRGKALGFFAEYGALFGVRNAQAELVETGSFKDQYGATHVAYKQVYQGVPVFGGVVRVHLDASNNLTTINGVTVPDINLSTSPKLSAAQAGDLAIAAVVADPPKNEEGVAASIKASDLAASATLYIYRIGLVRDVPGTNQLVYQVEVTNSRNVRDMVFVHAHSGKVVNRFSMIHDAHDGLFRVLYEQNTGNQVWQEGQPFPGSLNADQQNIVNFSSDSYYHFFNAFGRNSYDGLGAHLRSVNNDPTIACPNANWNGATTNYCNGVTADDIVAHEWGHAYTEYTHNLIYQWQSGALNESYSDIWGETVDQINGAGTDLPDTARTVGSCSTHTAPRPNVRINSPAEIATSCNAGAAAFGPPLTTTGVTGDVVLADDGVAPGSDACTPLPAGSMTGKIALVDRGTCGFTVKVKFAQDAGAVAVIVADNAPLAPAAMAGVDPTITIPSVRVTTVHGNLIKGALPGVNVTLRVGLGTTSEDSYKWLMGEDSTAFGGAIRDMWIPNCINHPGKVTDGMYHCTPDDGGGVHRNSGVPNHGYALLVDGGTYNGRSISAIGLVKAAHLYWRAQTVYQTPTSNFEDHANSLEAACADLIGQPLQGLSTSATPAGPSGQSISSADCTEVTDMIAAVELRTDPSEQCNFQPLLAQNPSALCANQKNPPVIYAEDFEDGLAGWTLTNQGVFAGWPGTNWAHATSLPGGRAGSAAFGENLQQGNCDGGAGDVSGVMRLESPSIHIPSSNTLSPRLTFEHYVATETGWDGGNLKISINGGAYTLVPASAFQFNPYNTTLQTAAAGNTNPLAGQPGYSGTDGGSLGGSWGQSQVDLTQVGAKPGDTIRLRFDFGMDGCTGVDGWYVDDVKVRACNIKKSALNDALAAILPSND
jgi:Zn-dependent metalloprotease